LVAVVPGGDHPRRPWPTQRRLVSSPKLELNRPELLPCGCASGAAYGREQLDIASA
jgi:hypothetical protein